MLQYSYDNNYKKRRKKKRRKKRFGFLKIFKEKSLFYVSYF